MNCCEDGNELSCYYTNRVTVSFSRSPVFEVDGIYTTYLTTSWKTEIICLLIP